MTAFGALGLQVIARALHERDRFGTLIVGVQKAGSMPYSKDCSSGGAIASLILERPLCVACLARKASASESEVLHAIETMSRVLKVKTDSWDRCRSCTLVGYTYSLAHD